MVSASLTYSVYRVNTRTSALPPTVNEQEDTGLLCPLRVCRSRPVWTSQRPTQLSQLQEASKVPQGENWHHVTPYSWPLRV